MRPGLETMEILGIPLSALASYDQAIDYVAERTRQGVPTFCVALSPEKSQRAREDAQLMRIIRSAELRICDGIGMAIAAKILHGRKVARVTGVELFQRLIARAETEGFGVYLLGASRDSNSGACEALRAAHPSLRIVGRQHGYFDDDRKDAGEFIA